MSEYEEFLELLRHELTWAFGGCSIIEGVRGTYRSTVGFLMEDRINVLYTDTPLSLETDFDAVSRYTDNLRETVSVALDEEAILVTASKIYWSG